MKIFLVPLFLLTGCAGVTQYEVTTPDGLTLRVKNSKDYDSYELRAYKSEDGSYTVILDEKGVSSSDPAKVAQDANMKLLDKLLNLVPKQ